MSEQKNIGIKMNQWKWVKRCITCFLTSNAYRNKYF